MRFGEAGAHVAAFTQSGDAEGRRSDLAHGTCGEVTFSGLFGTIVSWARKASATLAGRACCDRSGEV
jgi:hypothetical protein